MKILLAYPNQNENKNLYVNSLVQGLEKCGCSIILGLDFFWNKDLFDFDIVHIQWPESLFNWRPPTENELVFLQTRLSEIKKKASIIYTRHNALPHQTTNNKNKIYQLIEKNCDAIIHLGSHSMLELLGKKNEIENEIQHVVIPHHLYDEVYNRNISQTEARRILKWPGNKKILLCFGSFRHQRERDFVLSAYKKSKTRKSILIAPRWFNSYPVPPSLKKPLHRLKHFYNLYHLKLNRVYINWEFIPDSQVPLYFIAADAVLIQRLDTLNSGNITMSVLFNKPVIGPAVGNMKEQLEEIVQPMFNPKNISSCATAIDLAFNTFFIEYPSSILKDWSTAEIAQKHLHFYEQIKKEALFSKTE